MAEFFLSCTIMASCHSAQGLLDSRICEALAAFLSFQLSILITDTLSARLSFLVCMITTMRYVYHVYSIDV